MPNLSYIDLDYYLSDVDLEAIEDLVNPIAGAASLIVRRVSSNGPSASCNFAPKTPTFPQGLARGTLQALVDNPAAAAGNEDALGLLCMQSQRNLTASGSAYGLQWNPVGQRLQLTRYTLGLVNAAGRTVLMNLNPFALSVATLLLAWRYDAASDRVFLYCYTGEVSDFSDLQLRGSVVDSTGNLTAHVTEGGYAQAATGGSISLRFDDMTLKGP